MKRIPIYLKILLTAILIVLLVKTFAFTSCSIPSTGMENTLYQGEKVLVNKWSYGLRIPFTASHFLTEKARKGDVVLFNNPVPANRETPVFARQLFISRCVGVPGDTLMMNSELMVTGGRTLSPAMRTPSEVWIFPRLPGRRIRLMDWVVMRSCRSSEERNCS